MAAAFTIIALPSVWLLDRDTPTVSPSVAAAGVPGPQLDPADPIAATTTPEIPVFLTNTVAAVAPAVVDIALAAPLGANEAEGGATYQHFLESTLTNPCTAPVAPSGATITIVNIDNGLSTTCINTLGSRVPPNIAIVIQTDTYTGIADLVDAPIPVRISW